MSRVVASIEVRMRSTRLPGKALLAVCGKPLLELLIERVSLIRGVDRIVIATTSGAADDPIAALGERLRIPVFRGSEENVLERVIGAVEMVEGGLVMELTGDNPMIDPEIAAQTLELFRRNSVDYASNCDVPGFPNGMNVQVFPLQLLKCALEESSLPADLEHVSWFIRRQPDRFRKIFLPPRPQEELPELRLTVDEPADFELTRRIFETLYPGNPRFALSDILRVVAENPELLKLNAAVKQKVV